MTTPYLIEGRTDETEAHVDPQETADERAVMESFLTGKPLDPKITRRVHERAWAIRERVFREHGLVDIAVPAIRELRDE